MESVKFINAKANTAVHECTLGDATKGPRVYIENLWALWCMCIANCFRLYLQYNLVLLFVL